MTPTSSPAVRTPTDLGRGTVAARAIGVTVIPGDGSGAEVVDAARRVVDATGARIAWEVAEAGAALPRGVAGVPRATIDSVARTGLVLVAPTASAAHGGASATAALRRLFETYATLLPVRELPGMATPFAGRGIDLVVVGECAEGLGAAIEHMQTPDVAQALSLVTRPGCARVARVAFELAQSWPRRSVHCATDVAALRLTEGMMRRTFDQVAAEYPRVVAHHLPTGALARQLVVAPERLDVVVTTSANGEVIRELAGALVGGPDIAPSARIGDDAAIFEAVHRTAAPGAACGAADPTALIFAASMLLRHVGEHARAAAVEQAVVAVLARGVRTADRPGPGEPLGTAAFADAVIAALDVPAAAAAPPRSRATGAPPRHRRRRASLSAQTARVATRTVGADVFVQSDWTAEQLGESLKAIATGTRVALRLISNRGTQVYPAAAAEPALVDHYRCRFTLRNPDGALDDRDLLTLLQRVSTAHRWMHVEKLQSFGGEPGFTRGQGEE
jgi:isocitrate dehydrogenase